MNAKLNRMRKTFFSTPLRICLTIAGIVLVLVFGPALLGKLFGMALTLLTIALVVWVALQLLPRGTKRRH